MPTLNPSRPYTIPGFRIALVREPGVRLAERPSLTTPAEAALTRRLAAAGTLLGIEILDHLVLGEAGRFVSLRERGVL
jgi:DNA repair protein RadC